MELNKEFICDHCKGIVREDDGHIIFKYNSEINSYDEFKIIHKSTCDKFYDDWSWEELGNYIPLSTESIVKMLSLINAGTPFVSIDNTYTGKQIYEWTELMRRLYIPNFEESRKYKDTFIRLCHEYGENEETAYSENFLKKVIEEGGKGDI